MKQIMHQRRVSKRAGFTLIEVLIVVSIIAITLKMAIPPLHDLYVNEKIRSTSVVLRSYLASARSVAVQHGRTAVFHSSNSSASIWVMVDSSGTMVSLRPRLRLDSLYTVTLLATADSIAYDARGRAIGLSSPQTYTLSSAQGTNKLVCITLLGGVESGACVQ